MHRRRSLLPRLKTVCVAALIALFGSLTASVLRKASQPVITTTAVLKQVTNLHFKKA